MQLLGSSRHLPCSLQVLPRVLPVQHRRLALHPWSPYREAGRPRLHPMPASPPKRHPGGLASPQVQLRRHEAGPKAGQIEQHPRPTRLCPMRRWEPSSAAARQPRSRRLLWQRRFPRRSIALPPRPVPQVQHGADRYRIGREPNHASLSTAQGQDSTQLPLLNIPRHHPLD